MFFFSRWNARYRDIESPVLWFEYYMKYREWLDLMSWNLKGNSVHSVYRDILSNIRGERTWYNYTPIERPSIFEHKPALRFCGRKNSNGERSVVTPIFIIMRKQNVVSRSQQIFVVPLRPSPVWTQVRPVVQANPQLILSSLFSDDLTRMNRQRIYYIQWIFHT